MLDLAAELIEDRQCASRGGGSPPMSPSSLPCRAGVVEPPTGHSTKTAPLAVTFGASAVSTFGGTVLISMNSLPVTPADKQARSSVIDRVDR